MRIQDCKIVEKIFKKDRWYVVLDQSFNGRKTMPYAHYVWLEGNPAFDDIPKGYTVHHLDWDETNDDISNLGLMQKHHHTAHHWKNKKNHTDVKINSDSIPLTRTQFFPLTEPKAYKYKNREAWFVQFTEVVNDKRVLTKLTRYGGKVIRNEATAKQLAFEINELRLVTA